MKISPILLKKGDWHNDILMNSRWIQKYPDMCGQGIIHLNAFVVNSFNDILNLSATILSLKLKAPRVLFSRFEEAPVTKTLVI